MPIATKRSRPSGHLDAREPLLAGLRVAHEQRRGSATGPRCRGTAGPGRRRAASAPGRSGRAKTSLELGALVVVRVVHARRRRCPRPRARGRARRARGATARPSARARARGSPRASAAASGRRASAPRAPEIDLVVETGDAHHEELVEDRRDDPAELHPLEQRLGRVGGELEHAPHQVELRELPVQEDRAWHGRPLGCFVAVTSAPASLGTVVNGGLRFGYRRRSVRCDPYAPPRCGTTGCSSRSPSSLGIILIVIAVDLLGGARELAAELLPGPPGRVEPPSREARDRGVPRRARLLRLRLVPPGPEARRPPT